MIETLGSQTDRAFLAIGMILDIQLVQHQTELADDKRQDKYKSVESVRHVSGNCGWIDHEWGE